MCTSPSWHHGTPGLAPARLKPWACVVTALKGRITRCLCAPQRLARFNNYKVNDLVQTKSCQGNHVPHCHCATSRLRLLPIFLHRASTSESYGQPANPCDRHRHMHRHANLCCGSSWARVTAVCMGCDNTCTTDDACAQASLCLVSMQHLLGNTTVHDTW